MMKPSQVEVGRIPRVVDAEKSWLTTVNSAVDQSELRAKDIMEAG